MSLASSVRFTSREDFYLRANLSSFLPPPRRGIGTTFTYGRLTLIGLGGLAEFKARIREGHTRERQSVR